MSEDIVAEPRGAGWSLGLVRAPLQLLRELKPGKRPFWVFMSCVHLYSKRRLTYPNGVLDAFHGGGAVEIHPESRTVTGKNVSGAGKSPNFAQYFVLQFDHDFSRFGTWENPEESNGRPIGNRPTHD